MTDEWFRRCLFGQPALTAERTPPSAQDETRAKQVDLHGTVDARVWAREWCRIAREIEAAKDGRVLIDEGWMLSWFANAIMCGWDHAKRGQPAAPSPPPSDPPAFFTARTDGRDEQIDSEAPLPTVPMAPPSDPERATLVEHLRESFDRYTPGQCKLLSLGPDCRCLKCAADQLDADAREIARLDRLARACGDAADDANQKTIAAKTRLKAADAEIAALRQHLQAERTRAEQAETWQAETCAWEEDDDTTSYTTACGQHWQFSEGGTVENGARYCYHCGRRIQLQPAER